MVEPQVQARLLARLATVREQEDEIESGPAVGAEIVVLDVDPPQSGRDSIN